MSTIQFFAQGEPKGQPRPRAFAKKMGNKFVARVYDDATAEGWKSCIAVAARPHLPREPIAKPVKLTVRFWMPRPKGHFRTGKYAGQLRNNSPNYHTSKPDCDNLMKAVMDCLTTLQVWRDDTQVVEMQVSKVYGSAARVGALVTIEPLGVA